MASPRRSLRDPDRLTDAPAGFGLRFCTYVHNRT